MFAIIDIETTGGNARDGRITEIAILLHDGKKITGRFETLLNPKIQIPRFITHLTGITVEMVRYAPEFHEIADQILNLTDGRIFTAHNSKFDYGFLQYEFHRIGYPFLRDTLCTFNLSRKIFPGLRSYGLENLSQYFQILNRQRHRAAGDAEATSSLLEIIIGQIGMSEVEKYIVPWDRVYNLPKALSAEELHSIPAETGAYFFKDESDTIIYSGRATNLNQKIIAHFSRTRKGISSRIIEKVCSFNYELTGNIWIAMLAELEIRKQQNRGLNCSNKNYKFLCAIYSQIKNGYLTLYTDRLTEDAGEPLMIYQNRAKAQQAIEKVIQKFELCSVYCNLELQSSNGCFGYKIKQCRGACVGEELPEDYNLRVKKAISTLQFSKADFLLIGSGRNSCEHSAILVRKGRFCGYGFFHTDYTGSVTEILDCIKPATHYPECIPIILAALKNRKVKVIELNTSERSSVY